MTKDGNSQIMRTITLLITIFSLSFPAYAQYSGGTGEPNDPYQIATAEDLTIRSQDGVFSSVDVSATGAIAKTAASSEAWDMLIVSKADYDTAKIPLTSPLDSIAKITLQPSSSHMTPVSELMGWATVNGNTTGGGNASPTKVKSLSELRQAAGGDSPRVIIVSGTINSGASAIKIGSNKTIMGADKNATIGGGIVISGSNNVIVRNLSIKGVGQKGADAKKGPWDCVGIDSKAHHVWIDHLNISDAGDGLLDIKGESSYITVSWCKFWYTENDNDHRLACLIGSGGDHPEDWEKLKVTYHHNWFADMVSSRMPRIMYGEVHVFNDYYTSKGNGYCIGVGSYGSALIENNYFKDVSDPHGFMYDVYCWITARGNAYHNTKGHQDNGKGGERDVNVKGWAFPVKAFTDPPYKYVLDKVEDIPNIVSKYAGPQ